MFRVLPMIALAALAGATLLAPADAGPFGLFPGGSAIAAVPKALWPSPAAASNRTLAGALSCNITNPVSMPCYPYPGQAIPTAGECFPSATGYTLEYAVWNVTGAPHNIPVNMNKGTWNDSITGDDLLGFGGDYGLLVWGYLTDPEGMNVVGTCARGFCVNEPCSAAAAEENAPRPQKGPRLSVAAGNMVWSSYNTLVMITPTPMPGMPRPARYAVAAYKPGTNDCVVIAQPRPMPASTGARLEGYGLGSGRWRVVILAWYTDKPKWEELSITTSNLFQIP